MKNLVTLFLALTISTTFAGWQYTVYAGYFYYFAKHTAFETDKNHHEFKIGVFGSKDMFQATRHMALSKKVDHKMITVANITALDQSADMHILYLDKSKVSQLSRAIAYCEKHHILLVTDIPGASKKGADIELWEDTDNNIRFSINGPACESGHLRLSSILFNMSKTH